MQDTELIIWDWNGTLLNDTELCIRSINTMLRKRELPELTKQRYLDVFTFPVINYYRDIGFDFEKESWDPVAMEFIHQYLYGLESCQLATGAWEVLEKFRNQGLKQVIISAMQHQALVESVESLEIEHYFDYIGGIGDHYAGGKTENAKDYFASHDIPASKALLIGDTMHDSEVAGEIGCNCILVAAGHQSYQRLASTGRKVYHSLIHLAEDI